MQKQVGIISLGGAFNPVHTQHLAVLDLARTYLESTNEWEILGGYCAISTEGYVKTKLKTDAMKHKHRAEMVKLSYQQYPWMREQPSPDVVLNPFGSAQELGKRIKKELKRDDVRILVIVGADRIMSKDKPKWRRKLKPDAPITVCVGRGDSMDEIKRRWDEDKEQGLILHPDKFILIDASAQDVSSTLVRQHLKSLHGTIDPTGKRELMQDVVGQNLLFQNVSDYILANETDLYL